MVRGLLSGVAGHEPLHRCLLLQQLSTSGFAYLSLTNMSRCDRKTMLYSKHSNE